MAKKLCQIATTSIQIYRFQEHVKLIYLLSKHRKGVKPIADCEISSVENELYLRYYTIDTFNLVCHVTVPVIRLDRFLFFFYGSLISYLKIKVQLPIYQPYKIQTRHFFFYWIINPASKITASSHSVVNCGASNVGCVWIIYWRLMTKTVFIFVQFPRKFRNKFVVFLSFVHQINVNGADDESIRIRSVIATNCFHGNKVMDHQAKQRHVRKT